MVGVKGVAQPEHELQLRTELEVGEVAVYAQSHLHEDLCLLELQVVVGLAGEVYGGCHTGHEVHAVVVAAWAGEDEVEG